MRLFCTRRYLYATIDTTTFTINGAAQRAPLNYADPELRDCFPHPMVVDESNLLYSSVDGGIALEDPLAFISRDPNLQLPFSFSLKPSAGPIGANTSINVGAAFPIGTTVFFGGQSAPLITHADGVETIISPASTSAGPVTVEELFPDGSFSLAPFAFTNGVIATDLEPRSGPPDGAVPIFIVGYGIHNDPGSVQVSIGGMNAPILGVGAYGNGYPLPIGYVAALLPPGTANLGPLDVTVKTSAGSSTLHAAFSYEPEIREYPTTDKLTQLVFDTRRQLVFGSAGDHIDVFSVVSRSFLASIPVPTLHGTKALKGITLTPDGSLLAVANFSDQSVALINPDQPSQASLIPVLPSPAILGSYGPVYVAATSAGKIFVTIGQVQSVSGCATERNLLQQIDVASLEITARNDSAPCLLLNGAPMSASRDGSHVLIIEEGSEPGSSYIWDKDSDSFIGDVVGGFAENLAISDDGQIAATQFQITDAKLNVISQPGLPEFFVSGEKFGEKLSASGALFLFPTPSGIDEFDVHHGFIRKRIGLSQMIPDDRMDVMAIDPTSQFIFLITNNGLAVLNQKVPLSIISVSPSINEARPGTLITLKGSGFAPGATVTVQGSTITSTFIDSTTLQFALPTPVKEQSMTVANPDGEKYTY